ncbi:hypothetical protein EC9_21920 [Rosistilla ulvae]|uniref:Carboxypeptidase regulatory-like domain-containing protein n=1 Tax=Rosistilla ulvae TaxID=1930277 RepID=A0A517LZG6_9BACT|nr:hypothetical protein [Rosistilla ulvae]QDS88006.1 hypothetical protein EC9_21920 [Rosistilla ulvae]
MARNFLVTISIFAFGMLMFGCSPAPPAGFGEVHGTVSVDSKPAPEGTRVRFLHAEDDATAFFAMVNANGEYSYKPPTMAPLKPGVYHISVEPVSTQTTTDSTGLSVESPDAQKPKDYGKYSDPEKSGLTTTLEDGSVQYDIEITN